MDTFNRKQNPCPHCGGWDDRRLGEGRCWGYRDGDYVFCTNDRANPNYDKKSGGDTYSHRWSGGRCKCGQVHNGTTQPPSPAKPLKPLKETAHWNYYDESGNLDTIVVRFEDEDNNKDYRQFHPGPDGKRQGGAGPVKHLLYKLPELLKQPKDKAVLIVEGEKCVDILWERGVVATCNIGGAGKWDKSYNKYLAGRKVIIIPDNDPEFDGNGKPHHKGQKHAALVASELMPYCSVRVCNPLPGVKIKGDIYDWFTDGHTLEELGNFVVQFPWHHVPKHRYHETELDEIPPVKWLLKPFLQSKAINMLSGESGTGKSFIAIHWAKEIARTQSVLYLAAEDPSQYPERIKAWNTYHKFDPRQSQFYLETLPVNLISREKTEEIIEANNDIKPKLVVIDTWAAATAGSDEVDNGEIETILGNARRFAEEWDCSVLVVHHFNKVGTAERGGSALKAGVVQAMKAFLDQDTVRIEFDKTRNGQKPSDVFFKFERVSITVKLPDGTVEIRSQQVPVETDFAAIDPDNLSASQEAILRWMGAIIRRENEHRAGEIETGTNLKYRTLTDSLDKLKHLRYIEQKRARGPYKITREGLIKVGYEDDNLILHMQ